MPSLSITDVYNIPMIEYNGPENRDTGEYKFYAVYHLDGKVHDGPCRGELATDSDFIKPRFVAMYVYKNTRHPTNINFDWIYIGCKNYTKSPCVGFYQSYKCIFYSIVPTKDISTIFKESDIDWWSRQQIDVNTSMDLFRAWMCDCEENYELFCEKYNIIIDVAEKLVTAMNIYEEN